MADIRAIIIDDEEPARDTLASFVETFCTDVTVLAKCSNVPEGVLAINKLNPDLVFLDVEMPEYNGFELFDFIKQVNFDVIFVTAYSEYAVRAFEVSAIDYLLKPIQIESLRAAVEKVKEKKKNVALQQRVELLKDSLNGNEIRKIAIPMNDGLLFIDVSEIMLLEADGSYCHVVLKNGTKVLVSKKLKFFEDLLRNRTPFFRAHRSFIINLNYIKKYLRGESTIEMDNGDNLTLARERKQDFENTLKELGLSI
jgi:two-component system LytT family response regulator